LVGADRFDWIFIIRHEDFASFENDLFIFSLGFLPRKLLRPILLGISVEL